MNSLRIDKISVVCVFVLFLFGFGIHGVSFAAGKNSLLEMEITPKDGLTGVQVKTSLVIQFNGLVKRVNGDTLTSKNAETIFTLEESLSRRPVDSIVKWSPTYKKLTIQPKNQLSYGTRYRLTVKKDQIKNQSGVSNAIKTSEFTTEIKEPKLEMAFFPNRTQTEVPIDTMITVTFNKHMQQVNKKEITDAAIPSIIKVTDTSNRKISFKAHWDVASHSISIDPAGNLAPGETYMISLLANKLSDRQGDKNEAINSSFSTRMLIDDVSPTVSIQPAHGAKGVSLSTTITVQFAEDVVLTSGESLSTMTVTNLVWLQDSSQQQVNHYATWNKSKRMISIQVSKKLQPFTTYTLSLPSGVVKDTAGNLNSRSVISFTTKGR